MWNECPKSVLLLVKAVRDAIEAFQYFKGAYKKDMVNLFSKACHNRMRGDGFKPDLVEGRHFLQ